MWKPNQAGNQTPSTPEPARPGAASTGTTTPNFEAPRPTGASVPGSTGTGEQATIGKSLVIKGELTGSAGYQNPQNPGGYDGPQDYLPPRH